MSLPTEGGGTRSILIGGHSDRVGAGRAAASAVRAEIEALAENYRVRVDLSGVDAMSPSYADELFARLPQALLDSHRVQFFGASAQVRRVAAFVMSARRRDASREGWPVRDHP